MHLQLTCNRLFYVPVERIENSPDAMELVGGWENQTGERLETGLSYSLPYNLDKIPFSRAGVCWDESLSRFVITGGCENPPVC